jgi:large conductance mechanosensitive channel
MNPEPQYPPVVEAGVSILSEFREFIARGNVIDLAVGVIIGASFNKIVSALVDGLIMPPIGLLMGGVDFSDLQWLLRPDNPATAEADAVAIQYGAFINTVIQFLIVAWAVFILVKIVNTIRRKEAEKPSEATPSAPPPQEALLMEIRDLLKPQAAPAPRPGAAAKPPAVRKPAAKRP